MFYNCYNIEGVGLMAYNEASKNATMKYQRENLEQIRFWAPKGLSLIHIYTVQDASSAVMIKVIRGLGLWGNGFEFSPE